MGTAPTALQWLNVLINVLLPIVVAVVTSRTADGAAKALTLLVLSAIAGLGTSALAAMNAGQAFDWSQAGFTTLVGFVIAVASHFGVWKPAALTGSAGVIQLRMPGGLGGARSDRAA
jgi:hypothetical protein